MKTRKYIYWFDGQHWNGYLEENPEHIIQANNEYQLQQQLKRIYQKCHKPFMKNIKYLGDLEISP